MRFVLTGATGFVGGAIARQLSDDGHEVIALVRTPARAGHLRHLDRVAIVQAELGDRAATRAAAIGADGLFHVAGWYKLGTRDRSAARTVNVDGTKAVLSAAVEAGIPKIVYTSTLAVNSDTHGRVVDETYRFTGRHVSLYDASKAEAHRVAVDLAATGAPVVTVMPGVVYGPGDTSQTGEIIAQVVHGRRPVVPRGTGYCWAHVDDIARGHLLAMEHGRPGEAYMLAGPPATLGDVLDLVARLAGTRPVRTLPNTPVRRIGALLAALQRWPVPLTYRGESLLSAVSSYLGDPAKAQDELAWTARTIEVGMTETVQHLRTTAAR